MTQSLGFLWRIFFVLNFYLSWKVGMHRPAESKPNYQFGVYTVDVRTCELRKHGYRIKLQERPFQLLLALVERPGELVTREELRRRLWPEGTFVDFDHNISSSVNKLRAALNDSARHPHYIETAGRRGYRFLYPVTLAKPSLAAKHVVTIESAVGSRRTLATAVLLILVAIGAGVFFFARRYSATSTGAIRSIAVLPLKNLSSDPEQEYFSQGLTDELTARLASLQGLRVMSATSAQQYKNTSQPLPVIARQLNVDAIVEGSVMRAGGRVRITAQLIDGRTDQHIWAESYERDQRDILTLQNDVTRDIAAKIKLNLDPTSRARLLASQPVDPKAHEEYLRGRYLWSKRSDFQQAISHFEAAVAADPNYAPAYAGLADSYGLLSGYTLAPQDQVIPKARAAALKALELDPNLPEAHTSLALIAQNYDWDWTTAEKEYRRAIELDPNYATGHQWYGEFLSFLGRFEEADAEMKRARELDPLSPVVGTDFAVLLYYERKYDQAMEQFRAVLARDPDFGRAHMITMVYVQKHMYAEALAENASIHEETPMPWTIANLVYLYGKAGQIEKARATDKMLATLTRGQVDPGPEIYAALGLGDKDRVFAGFKVALMQHSNVLISLKVNPAYDPLRSDPRFRDLMKRIGLSQ